MNNLKSDFESEYDCSMIDGIKFFIDNGWGLLRASNTQPVIVCRIEAKSNKELNMVFQPHRYTRTKDLFSEFVDVLTKIDNLILLDIYSAGEVL